MSRKSLAKQIDDLASEILEVAAGEGTPLADKLEAFKIVSGYHVGMVRAAKGREADESGPSFQELRKGLRAVGGSDA
jgi:hypothetical protein